MIPQTRGCMARQGMAIQRAVHSCVVQSWDRFIQILLNESMSTAAKVCAARRDPAVDAMRLELAYGRSCSKRFVKLLLTCDTHKLALSFVSMGLEGKGKVIMVLRTHPHSFSLHTVHTAIVYVGNPQSQCTASRNITIWYNQTFLILSPTPPKSFF